MRKRVGFLFVAVLVTLCFLPLDSARAFHPSAFYAREAVGLARGPAFQVYDQSGNLVFTRFVLNPDFTTDLGLGRWERFDFKTFFFEDGILVCGRETAGLARGPAFQVWDSAGNLQVTRFVLNPDFTETNCLTADLDFDGSNEIIVWGRETLGLARGPAFQIFDLLGNLLLTRFVLNPDFTEVTVATPLNIDFSGREILIGGRESAGLARGYAHQVWDRNGTFLFTRFILNGDFRGPLLIDRGF